MNKALKYSILLVLLIVGGLSLFSGTISLKETEIAIPQAPPTPPEDTAASVRYPVRRTQIKTYEDLNGNSPIDLRDPSNVKTEIEYDLKNNVYLFKTKIGDQQWVTPFSMNQQEYNDYTLKQSMSNYFRIKNAELFDKGSSKEDFALKDIKLNLGPAEKIFGPGGIKFRPQGYVEFAMGFQHSYIDNPTLSQNNRSKTIFNVDEKIQLSVNASVGDKVNFDLNYDTEATFNFDSKRIKLAYEGKEDEIIKYLEAGNVSLNTTNSLISGASTLFGIRADLQFGKLRINTVFSQQESESQTVSSKGGVQTTAFDFMVDNYDENRHFFLGYYFRDAYDNAMSKLPYVQSPVTITKMEVWVTNKRGNFDNARNIVAFADLGETDSIKNRTQWQRTSTDNFPSNGSNNLYSTILTTYKGARDINQVTQVFDNTLTSGLDYEKVQSSRLLGSTEYTFNPQIGYISLNFTLQADEVLAVAYEYTMRGQSYKVGEFAAEVSDSYTAGEQTGALFLKLLKPVALSPRSYSWDLMMKNVYSLGAFQLQSDKFRLNISYQNDTTGTFINYLPDGDIKDQLLLSVMGLDRLNSRQNTQPDGIFDYVEGFTVNSTNGRIIFPTIEPFGSHLKKAINDPVVAQKYIYQELYDSTLTVARQIAEKNKFKLSGVYKASNNDEISLNATNVARGSVRVTAGGVLLTEGTHYTVDYMAGTVRIIDPSIKDSGTPINVSLENQSLFSMQRKTMMGLNLSYDISKNFNIGGTVMHMYEKPLTAKVEIGNESVKNTLWGLNTSYHTESQYLTNLIDKLPFVNATVPSKIALNAEFAQMLPGHYENKYAGGYSFLDDFESASTSLDIHAPYGWVLASTPSDRDPDTRTVLFPEATLIDNIDYGKNRAHLAWFTVDNLFTRRNSSLKPSHITKNDQSNHFVREVNMYEIFPNRESLYNEAATISTLNLSYYPERRGPYNLDIDLMDPNGKLMNPKDRWGGIARKMEVKDFEAQNYEYIEFWLMDPFVYNDTATVKNEGGDLYFNLGEISEDILKDGRKFYENGLPLDGDTTLITTSVWGKIPRRQSTVYGFEREQGDNVLKIQDVGLNGLSTAEEFEFGAYKDYIERLRNKLNPDALARFQEDPFSPLNDPGGDNYHYFRGSDFDREEVSILDRYKFFNGTEGNSIGGNESFTTASRSVPDVEDINQDYTLNETESYYQYKVKLYPDSMSIENNRYITDIRTVSVKLANGNDSEIKWYQFKVPLRQPTDRVGNIHDFKSIRYMRMFLTNFAQETFLRFGTLQLVRGDWRIYTQNLNPNIGALNEGTLNVATVNIEENSDKQPVNYVLPPGVSRILDPSQPQLRQENEQALLLRVQDLSPEASRAVFKTTTYDLRRYKRLQMFTHAAELENGDQLKKGELTVFIRFGSDYKSNFYEYEIPLTITPPGHYNTYSSADQLIVWPTDNMFDFPLDLLKDVKLNRNKAKRKAGSTVSFTTLYYEYDPEKPNNKVSVMGNPSLSDISVIMIGVRNNSRTEKSGEIWVNELRVSDFDEEGGWAAQGNLNIALSDVGVVNVSGRKETIGFGSIDQSLMERRIDDYQTYNIATNVDLGRFLPEKAKVSLPLYYVYTNETTSPKYDPLNQDVTLKESLSLVESKAERDSINNLAQDKTVTKSFNINNARINIQSKTPMPYDPANFMFGYSQSISETSSPTIVYDQAKDYKFSALYTYSPLVKTWSPFANIKSKAPMARYAKSLGFNYVPNNITLNSTITRNYIETAIRDIENYSLGETNANKQFLSWSKEFYWDRNFNLIWDFTKNLRANIQTGTRAEIEEPWGEVNKKLNPDRYEIWKDSVIQSIKSLGRPLSYNQTARVTYTLPFTDVPFLDWISSTVDYTSNYTWDRGAEIDADIEVGNQISNNVTYTLNHRMNMLNLYNKSPFLRKVNQKFGASTRAPQRPRQEAVKPKKFEREVTLQTDTTTSVRHNLNTKNIRVTAKRENGRVYQLKYKKVDNNTILITTNDSVKININVVQEPNPEENLWYKVAEYSARGLMSVRTISLNYSRRNESHINGFRPAVGDIFGQNQTSYGYTPGVGFAFGFDGGESYINDAIKKDWLIMNDSSNISPAIFNDMEKFDFRAQLEPFRGLRVELIATREQNNSTQVQYMFEGSPKVLGGSFAMSTISISSAFESASPDNRYYSGTFEKFLSYRNIIAQRFGDKFYGMPYPRQAGTYDGQAVSTKSADVLIPAFLAAYTGKDPGKISLSPFPSLSALVPNWNITYDGLTTLPFFKDKFKTLRLTHGYTSQYRVASFQSFSSWTETRDGFGFRKDLAGDLIPSSPFDISTVSIIEQFNPLFGAEGVLQNSMTIRGRYNTQRTLNLSVSAFQIVESRQREFVLGMGYRINEFNRVIGLTPRNSKGFNNDLNINADISQRVVQALIRKIEEGFTQITSGSSILTVKLSADYALSKSLMLRAFYDRIINNPLVSASSYPTTNTNFGLSLRFTLTQ